MSVVRNLSNLRRRMKQRGLHAYLVPSTDPHMSEYVPERWQRRRWLSGFSGSAGEVVVTDKRAGLWTDGRYFLQAEAELAGSGITLYRQGEDGVPSVEEFLQQQLKGKKRLGCDPRLLSIGRARSLEKALAVNGARLELVDENLVDLIWEDQPDFPSDPIELHPLRHAGKSSAEKLRALRALMRERGADTMVVSTLDAVAWLFNIRGRDVPYNPVVIAYALVGLKSAQLFLPPGKLPTRLRAKLGRGVDVQPYDRFEDALRKARNPNRSVWVDANTANRWIVDQLEGCDLICEETPIARMKARKNAAEIHGMRRCHERDGLAVVRFLSWLDRSVGRVRLTERSAAEKLEEFRALDSTYRGPSFGTISGYGPNGAIIHYGATEETDAKLARRGVYLVDSGGQYADGTTDITRTVLLGGKATRQQKEHFTRVLKGHIELARVKFPAGVRGMRLDTLARRALWEVGLDYNHGTGHGVGSYLNVHEGPQSISPGRCTGAELEPGNIQSNEPGFYLPGQYGIRIENLVLVVQDKSLSRKGHPVYGFETLTLCPIARALIDVKLLTPEERSWLDRYHERVYRTLAPELDSRDKTWLRAACAKL